MKKQFLNIEFDFNFLLIGICCGKKDYRICYEINKYLEINLKRIPDIKIKKRIEKKIINNAILELPVEEKMNTFSLFEYRHPQTDLKYNIISNKCLGTFLIRERKEVDYFLMINGEAHRKEKNEALTKVKSIEMVMTAFEIDPHELKSKDHLILND